MASVESQHFIIDFVFCYLIPQILNVRKISFIVKICVIFFLSDNWVRLFQRYKVIISEKERTNNWEVLNIVAV